jgi:hypothetical protein
MEEPADDATPFIHPTKTHPKTQYQPPRYASVTADQHDVNHMTWNDEFFHVLELIKKKSFFNFFHCSI